MNMSMNMSTQKILIVDDEPLARQRLATVLGDIADECPHTLVGQADGAQMALDMIGALQPDVVLLDVQMPGTTGIELAQHLLRHQSGQLLPSIIFVTAYDEFALKAFDVHALDYVLKPVRASRLAEALTRVGRLHTPVAQEALPAGVEAYAGRRRHFSILERGRILLVPLSDVLYLRAEQKYLTVRTRQREYLLEESLTAIEEEFSDLFVRVHRNALVARGAISGVERATHVVDADSEHEKVSESWQVIVAGIDERLPVSRRQWPAIKSLLKA